MYKGNATAVSYLPSTARSAANALLNLYSQYYRQSFGVSRDGLALELMYHAHPYLILYLLEAIPVSSNLYHLVDDAVGLTSHFYWADSGKTDQLRYLDNVAPSILDVLQVALYSALSI
ncbi:hypothetical protein [Alkalibaculum bacchi]|uniref:hypothetical protein n=1 Tax=Alkalibaculum bacchi TaxID=645887 RepID=UPI0026EC16A7|nr:hypothetical protein [Alkalibaculum bacchi]